MFPASSKRIISMALIILTGAATLPGCADRSDEGPAAAPTAEPTPEIRTSSIAIENAMAGWLATGVNASAGETVVLSADGTWEIQGLALQPKHLLWYRVGENGTAVNFSANTEVFESVDDGEVFVALRPLELYWPDARGTFPEGFSDAPPMPVEFGVEAMAFAGDAETGLRALAAGGEAGAGAALERLSMDDALPAGFAYLPYLGQSTIWSEGTVDGRPGVHVDTSDDAGIIRLPLDIPLNEQTTVSFDWRYDAIPALGPETEPQFHDYASIALEFDNGQDLTWFWSRELEPGQHFTCPLEWWDERETHWVLQSGDAGLGEWHSHERNVLADYQAAIDRPEPTRIVGLWFIGNSIFGRQPLSASFSDIRIESGGEVTHLLHE